MSQLAYNPATERYEYQPNGLGFTELITAVKSADQEITGGKLTEKDTLQRGGDLFSEIFGGRKSSKPPVYKEWTKFVNYALKNGIEGVNAIPEAGNMIVRNSPIGDVVVTGLQEYFKRYPQEFQALLQQGHSYTPSILPQSVSKVSPSDKLSITTDRKPTSTTDVTAPPRVVEASLFPRIPGVSDEMDTAIKVGAGILLVGSAIYTIKKSK